MDIPDYNVNVKVYNVDAMQMTLEIKEHLPIGKCLWCFVFTPSRLPVFNMPNSWT